MDTVNTDNNSVDELLKNARAELSKLHPHVKDQDDDEKQEYAKHMLEQYILFADNALKRLVAHTIGEDIDNLFDDYVRDSSAIIIKGVDENSNESNNYKLKLDVVDHDYMLDLKQFKNHSGVQERIVFLLNSVKVLYCPIKDYMKKWANDNNTTFNYVLQIGLNTTLFLDKDSKKRIGIVLTRVVE